MDAHIPRTVSTGPARPLLEPVDVPPPDNLTPGQHRAWELAVRERKPVFITGAAGCGKSHITRSIVAALRKAHGKRQVFVTASTGVAACNVGGVTIHSFAGVGLGREDQDTLVLKVMRNRRAVQNWIDARVLVIDEISMVDAALFAKLDHVAREVRGNAETDARPDLRGDRPWGGLQIIAVGDFLQLPPITRSEPRFAFQTPVWKAMFEAQGDTVALRTQVRQRDDERLATLLDAFRVGAVPSDAGRMLSGAGSELPALQAQGVGVTRLFSTNREVDRVNAAELAKLDGEPVAFRATDVGEKKYREALDRNSAAPSELLLKPGAAVILTRNLDVKRGLVNGASGVVLRIGFAADSGDGLEELEVPEGVSEDDLRDDPDVATLPVVRFLTAKGPRDVLVDHTEWNVELGGVVKATRVQLPLRLAYALSIHKSMGMTISALEVHLDSVFEDAQAYVALSRSESLGRLRVFGFDPAAVRANAAVVRYYAGLTPGAKDDGEGPTPPAAGASGGADDSNGGAGGPSSGDVDAEEDAEAEAEAAPKRPRLSEG